MIKLSSTRKAVEEENKEVVRSIVEMINKGNIDYIDEFFAEDITDHSLLGETVGRQPIKEGEGMIRNAFPDRTVTIEDICAEEDTVSARFTTRATHEGEFMGIEPTGRDVEFAVWVFGRMRNGRVIERWSLFDMFGLMQQLGVIEPLGE